MSVSRGWCRRLRPRGGLLAPQGVVRWHAAGIRTPIFGAATIATSLTPIGNRSLQGLPNAECTFQLYDGMPSHHETMIAVRARRAQPCG